MKRLALALLIGLAACARPSSDPAAEAPAPAASDSPSTAAPAAPPEADQIEVARSAGAFGTDLYRQLAQRDGNLFFSPLSITTAFGMVQAGARGETEAQIARVLHYSLPRERLHPALGALLRGLPIEQPGRRLKLANAVWVQRDYALLPDYARLLGSHYEAPPQSVDYIGGAQEAAARINGWAERNTAGRIRNLLRPNDLTPNTRLVLTNTVWMKADWLHQFEARMTRPRDFFGAGGAAQVPFMHQGGRFRHLEGPGFQAIELPYAGEELAMILFLPRARDGLGEFERGLDADSLERWIEALRAAPYVGVDLALPKVQIDTRYELERVLPAMGMELAFSGGADFSGIDGRRGLLIAKAIHQTFLLVDEKGTEAAAATAIVMNESAARSSGVRFHADHPYFLLIRDNRTGAILFMGRIAQPPKS